MIITKDKDIAFSSRDRFYGEFFTIVNRRLITDIVIKIQNGNTIGSTIATKSTSKMNI